MSGFLHDVLTAVQGRLSADLEASRTALPHPVAKGDASESSWQETLAAHLPNRYQVCRGVVVDARGEKSDEIDLIVYDRQYTPLLYNHDEQRVLPAEAVYSVFEVKQRIDRQQVKYAGEKAASVRLLRRTSAPVVHAGGRFEPREPFRIPAGLLAFDSDWHPPFGDAFRDSLTVRPEAQRLDLGCVVHAGAFHVDYGAQGVVSIQLSPVATALADFFLRLLALLQSLGTVPAIDYRAYGSAFGISGLQK